MQKLTNQAGEQTQRFSANGMRAVNAETMNEAAEIFANRLARKQYGRSGYARTCNAHSWAQNGSFAEYSAFIGYSSGLHETTGNNVTFTVHREIQHEAVSAFNPSRMEYDRD